MSSPSHSPSETRTQDSVHGSSQYGAADAIEDTASSVNIGRRRPSPTRIGGSEFPNTVFARGVAAVRSRSASPRPRRSPSPLGVSVAQRRAQLAAQSAATAVSGVGRVEAETRRVRDLVEATSAEAKSVRDEVESRIADLAAASQASASQLVEQVATQVTKVAEYTDAQASRVAADVTARLGKEVQAAATSAAATAEVTTRTVVEGARREIQAQIDANRADTLRQTEETKAQVQNISAQLAKLTQQLNQFRPASEKNVGEGYEQMSASFEEKFHTQQQEIHNLSTVVLETQKSMQANAETLHSILTGMENLGDHVRDLQAGMAHYNEEQQIAEDQYAEMEDQLLKEVPTVSINETKMGKGNSPIVSTPVIGTPILPTIPEEPVFQAGNTNVSMTKTQEQDMSERWNKLRQTVSSENAQRMNPAIEDTTRDPAGQLFQDLSAVEIPRAQSGFPVLSVTLPMDSARENIKATPRRITPIPVIPQGEVHRTSEGTEQAGNRRDIPGNASNIGGSTIDLRTETTATSKNTPCPTFGSTTIDTTEEQRIHTIVCRVMKEQYGEGRAALRKHLGLTHDETVAAERVSVAPKKESGSPSVPVGTEVPRTSFGSPLSIDGASPSLPSVSTGIQPFATAAWKPKEPPCFFGRSNEDAHTWVSLVRNYLTFMSGSDSQQVAYTVTLFRDAAHEWYMSYERRNRGPPRDWAGLVAALLDRFGSNIRSQEAQSQLMSISQGNRAVRDYASQFETLLGRLDSYDEGLMLNQFIWGLQPDLARSVSLHYPNTIAKAVSLAETTELAVKASRRPGTKMNTGSNPAKGPNQQNRGQGQWRGRGGNRGGRRGGSAWGSARGNTRGRGGNVRGRSYSVNFDPLACYRCGVRGHLARDCPQAAQSQGSVNAGPSRGTFSKSGQQGPKNRGRGRRVRFGGLNVLYDEEGIAYPVDDAGQLYVPLDCGQDADDVKYEEEKNKETKN